MGRIEGARVFVFPPFYFETFKSHKKVARIV